MSLFRLVASAALVLSQLGVAPAQDFPTRHITAIVPFAPGNSVDIVGRLLAGKMSELLGQQVAKPAGGLHRPDPVPVAELVGPCHQLGYLPVRGPHQPLGQHLLSVVDRDCGVGALVRVDTDHDHRDPPDPWDEWTAVGTPDLR